MRPTDDILLLDEYGDVMKHVTTFCIIGNASDDVPLMQVWRTDPSKPKAGKAAKKIRLLEDTYALMDIWALDGLKFEEAKLGLRTFNGND